MQWFRDFLENQKQPAGAHRPMLRLPDGQSFGKHLANQKHECSERNHRQRQRPVRVEDHAQRDCEHRRVGKRISQRQRCEQVLRTFEQLCDRFARARMLFHQLPHLPFAQGKQRRFRQREKETRARENQNRRHGLLHAWIVREKARRKKEKQISREGSKEHK